MQLTLFSLFRAHLCEETRKAVRDAPYGLLYAISGSAVMGFFLLISLLFAIQDFKSVATDPMPLLRVLTDSCGRQGGIVLMVLAMLCTWHCGLFSLVRPACPSPSIPLLPSPYPIPLPTYPPTTNQPSARPC